MKNNSDTNDIRKRITEQFVKEYKTVMEDASVSPSAAVDLSLSEQDQPLDQALSLKRYRNILEREAIGEMVYEYLCLGNARDLFRELTEGSVLGDMLEEIYAGWDETITQKDLEGYYTETKDMMDSISGELDDLTKEDRDDDDFKFLRELIEVTGGLDGEDEMEDTVAFRTLSDMIERNKEDKEDDDNGLANIDDFPFH